MSLLDQILQDRERGSVQGVGGGHRTASPLQGTIGQEQNVPTGENTGAGAVAGGLLGTLLASVPSTLAATKSPALGVGVAESIIGGMSGAGDMAETVFWKLQQGEPLTITEADWASAADASKESVMFGLGGRAAIKGFQKFGTYLKESVTPEVREAITFLKTHRPDQQFFTSSQLTENRLLDFMSNFAEHSVWGGGDVRMFKLQAQSVMQEISRDIAEKMGSFANTIHVGKMIKNIKKNAEDLNKIEPQNMYKVVAQGARKLGVNTAPLKRWAAPKAKTDQAIQKFGQSVTTMGLPEKIMKFKKTMTVADMMTFQRNVKAQIRSFQKTQEMKDAPVVEMLVDLDNVLDDIVEKGLRQPGADPVLLATKRQADALWKSHKNTFSNQVINDFVKTIAKSPELVMRAVFVEKNEAIVRAFKAVLPEQAMKKVRRSAIEELYNGATDVKTGMMKGGDLLESLIGDHGMGIRGVQELFGKEGADQVVRFAKALTELQKKTPISEGSLAIQFTQMGAVLAVGAGQFKKEAAGLIIFPKILAKLITNKQFNNWLLKGAKMSKFNQGWPVLAGRIAGAVAMAQGEKADTQNINTMKDLISGAGESSSILKGLEIKEAK